MCASLRLPRLAVAVLAPDIKSSPDDNSLGGGVRSPAILQGKKVDIGNMRTGEKLEKLVLGQNRNVCLLNFSKKLILLTKFSAK